MNKNPVKAIKEYCLNSCCMGSRTDLKECKCIDTCPLHPFRLGSNPYRKSRELTEEERTAIAERLKGSRK